MWRAGRDRAPRARAIRNRPVGGHEVARVAQQPHEPVLGPRDPGWVTARLRRVFGFGLGTPQPADAPIPSTLDTFISGAMGDSFHVTWDGSTLTHQHLGPFYALGSTLGLRPSLRQWVAFGRVLDDSGVWEWEDSYRDLGVMDGTGWSFTAGYADRRVESKGSNAYPPRFGEWLRAVSAL
jgi:hypothetical protein